MVDDPSSLPPWPWQTIIALFAGLGGIVFYFHGLDSQRPPVVGTRPAAAIGDEDVESRIWQDPFQAAWEYQDALKAGDADSGHSLLTLQTQIHRAQTPLLILPVMVPGGPYAELAENRLRARAALLEGLTVAGFELAAEDRIGYVNLPWPAHVTEALPAQARHDLLLGALQNARLSPKAMRLDPQIQLNPLTVPYEWLTDYRVPIPSHLLKPPAPHFRRVLVLWLEEDAFADFPLSRISSMIQALGASPPTGCNWRIIGPRTSTTLSSLVRGCRFLDSCDRQALRDVRFYCATPSAEDSLILEGRPEGETIRADMKQDAGAELFRLGNTDRQLCECLACELQSRGLNFPTDEHDSPRKPPLSCSKTATSEQKQGKEPLSDIAIISEADTRYGRALPLTFASVVSGTSVLTLRNDPTSMPCWIHTLTYLRGVDGRTADRTPEQLESISAEASSKQSAASKLTVPGEMPQGQDQADYLRRLADQLAQLDDSLNSQGRRLRAVGVLGTDVYDKLLILQAIRDRLPSLLFFTTGLDAEYALPSAWSATHNLLIASSYGFRLHAFYQNGVPPFRDSAQTAIFTAALGASGALQLPKSDQFGSLDEKPRLFEITRYGASDITPDATPDGEPSETALNGPPNSLHPPRYDLAEPLIGSNPYFFWRLLACAACLLGIPFFIFGVRPQDFHWRDFARNTLAFFIFALGGLILAWKFWPRHPEGEPLALLSGNSIWPSDALRVVAALLSIHLIVRSLIEKRENDKHVEEEFGLRRLRNVHEQLRLDNSVPGVPARWMATDGGGPIIGLSRWRVVGDSSGLLRPRSQRVRRHDQVYAQNLWWEYQRHSMWVARLVRVIPLAALTLTGFWLLSMIVGRPYVPARTMLAARIDLAITLASVFLFYSLTYWVMDVAYTNWLFIDYLMKAGTRYASRNVMRRLPEKISLADVASYLDIRLIAMRSKVVGEVVYYPFFVLALLILARCSIFADWDWTPFILTVFGINIVLATIAAISLRWTAETARKQAMQNIDERRLAFLAQGAAEKVSYMDELRRRVAKEREGAFSVLSQYPWIGALLLPSGSLGLWAILQYLPQLLRPG